MSLDFVDRRRDLLRTVMQRRRDGYAPSQSSPFAVSDLTFDFSRIRQQYRASNDALDDIIVYKGAPRGIEDAGLLSCALMEAVPEHVVEVKAIIEGGDDALIRQLFDEHTSYYSCTALLSATLNPQLAQMFAPSRPFTDEKKNRTIYQLRVKADRCVIDCYDTGHCGSSGEVLILGAIFPHEIAAVKIVNDDDHSELLTPCGGYIRWHPAHDSLNRVVKDETNWRRL